MELAQSLKIPVSAPELSVMSHDLCHLNLLIKMDKNSLQTFKKKNHLQYISTTTGQTACADEDPEVWWKAPEQHATKRLRAPAFIAHFVWLIVNIEY